MKPSFHSSILCTFVFLGLSYQEERQPRMFALFNVVKFKNEGCQSVSTADLQGVCMTKQECEDGGGTTDGNCAAGFGTCCIFTISGTTAACGGTVTRNCSYIENPEFPATRTTVGNCAFPVTRCSSDICQIRLDFKSTTRLGNPTTATGVCGGGTADSLVIAPGATNTAANSIPIFCGTLTDQHVYVDAGSADTAATLTFTTIAGGTKMWRVKVSQIECSSRNKAPPGCLQYLTGTTATAKSYNWDGTRACTPGCQTAVQDYNICFRQEAGMCGIQYSPSAVDATKDSFELAQKTAANANNNLGATAQMECLLSSASNNACLTLATDICSYIEIPGSISGVVIAGIAPTVTNDVFCGEQLNVMAGGTASGAVSTNTLPFRIRHVVSGTTSIINGATAGPTLAGFSIDATQTPC